MEIRDHALIYALLCRNIISETGKENGEELIRRITEAYGLKRGARMAELSEGRSISDFLIHGEWKGKEGENISSMTYNNDSTVSTVSKCVWYDTWKKYGLLDYGPYYCRYIDKAICKGFDGDFDLKVEKSIGSGDDACVFVWTQGTNEEYIRKEKEEANGKWIKPFSFHCQELYECAAEILADDIRDVILNNTKEDYDNFIKEKGNTQ